MFKRLASVFLLGTLCIAQTGTGRAAVLTYQLNNVNITDRTNDPGLKISTSVFGSALNPFNLDDGQSNTFALFKIWTDETAYNPDDPVHYPFSVTLDFLQPPPGGSSGGTGGQTYASTFLGIVDFGVLEWNSTNPFTVNYGGGSYQVLLTDNADGTPDPYVYYNGGLFGFTPGVDGAATVYATVTQIRHLRSGRCPGACHANLALHGWDLSGRL